MDETARYCDHCGQLMDPVGQRLGHEACGAARALEPPRYCARCGRRTVVKVTPASWSSRCSQHGLIT